MNDEIKKELIPFLATLTGGKFNIVARSVYAASQVAVEKDCYGFILINKGDSICTVNNISLKPFPPGFPDLSGESFSFVDPWRNVYTRAFTVSFVAGGTTPELLLIQVCKAM